MYGSSPTRGARDFNHRLIRAEFARRGRSSEILACGNAGAIVRRAPGMALLVGDS
jgi:hypothetical protein